MREERRNGILADMSVQQHTNNGILEKSIERDYDSGKKILLPSSPTVVSSAPVVDRDDAGYQSESDMEKDLLHRLDAENSRNQLMTRTVLLRTCGCSLNRLMGSYSRMMNGFDSSRSAFPRRPAMCSVRRSSCSKSMSCRSRRMTVSALISGLLMT